MNAKAAGKHDDSDTAKLWQTGRLWSLLDMQEFMIKPLTDALDILATCSAHISSRRAEVYPNLSDKQRTNISDYMKALLPQFKRSEMDMCALAAERLIEKVEETNNADQIGSCVLDLRRRIIDQGASTFCLVLSSYERHLFEETSPFGGDVEASFPSANEDICEASKCLALDRGTACVFHLMRALEVGAAAVAAKIGATVVDKDGKGLPWGVVAGNMKPIIDKMTKGSEQQIHWYRVQSSLETVNRAWRAPTAHPKHTYTLDEAERVFSATRDFMTELSALV